MSTTFRIKNQRKFFSYREVLTVSDIIQILPNLSQYSFDTDLDDWNFLNSKLSDFNFLRLGIEGHSILGFRISYNQKTFEYLIEVSDYATGNDWETTLNYVSALSEKLRNPIKVGVWRYSASKIINFDFYKKMKEGINTLLGKLSEYELYIDGIKRPIILGKLIREYLINHENQLDELRDILYNTQYPNSYYHKQTFHTNIDEKTIYGNYSIGEKMRCVLPTRPFVEAKNEYLLVGHPLTHWTMSVSFIDDNGDYILDKVCEYNSFFENIPKEKLSFIDENFVWVEELSRDELQAIIDKSTIMDKFGQFIK